MPAQHDTLHRDLGASWQEGLGGISPNGLSVAQAGYVPMPTLLADIVLLLRSAVLACDAVRALDDVSALEFALRGPPTGPFDSTCWVRCLRSREMQPAGMKFACWLRAAPHTHRSAVSDLHCHVYRELCTCWGTQIWHECVAVAVAASAGWRALADPLGGTLALARHCAALRCADRSRVPSPALSLVS